MNITFYSINKKQNSTKRPADSGVTYDCKLKEECSILTPNIKLDLGLSTAPSFNYAYISDWGRYYFIKNWTFYNRLWEADLEVDVLGTYKTEIGNSSMYVLRSASNYDVKVIDTFYPTKYENQFNKSEGVVYYNGKALPNYFNSDWEEGYFCLSLLGSTTYGVEYVITNKTGFKSLLNTLLSLSTDILDMGDMSAGLARQIANPIQYILAVYWIPAFGDSVIDGGNNYTTKLGYYEITIPYARSYSPIVGSSSQLEFTMTLDIHKHPQSSARGDYVNCNPYTKLILRFLPFGIFELDTSKLSAATTIDLQWYIDIATGGGALQVTSNVNNCLLLTSETKFGVTIPIAQLTQDVIAYANAGYQSVKSIGKTLTAGAVFGASGIIGRNSKKMLEGVAETGIGIMNALDAIMPELTSVGSNGSFISFDKFKPQLFHTYQILVDDDYEHSGRPLCKEVQISTLSGYVQCRDGDISLNATQEEREKVSDYLVGGFFYE